ncbi:MAG: sugar phosphate isomerase/epimerase family protein [Thermomicrobiales bacterium]
MSSTTPLRNLNEGMKRLSLNQKTIESWTVPEAIDGCVRHDVEWIGLWRDKVDAYGLAASAKAVRNAGLKVSSNCRGGLFPSTDADDRADRIEDNKRAIHEAAELGAEMLAIVGGGLNGVQDPDEARKMIVAGIEAIIPYAEARGVKLGIEPLHPALAQDRSLVSSMKYANDLVEHFNHPNVGLIVDVFHVWWDPFLYEEIARAGSKIIAFHVDDVPVHFTDVLMNRMMMGDGVCQIRRMREAVDAAGYTGPIEVEIFNQDIWDRDGDAVMREMKERFLDHVL